MLCENCGTEVPEGATACAVCGTAVAPNAQTAQNQAQQPIQAAPTYGYQQPYQAQAGQQTGTNRALAMSVYWGILPLIFAAVVADKNDPFIKHHMNQALVILIGSIISMVLTFILIGGILGIVLFVFTILATIDAYHGEMKKQPLIGSIQLIK